MPRTKQTQSVDESHKESSRLAAFLDAVRDTNPFTANRVTEPSPYDVDVPLIHHDRFVRLTALAGKTLGDARRAGPSTRPQAIGAALLGGSGVGKSHLLSRLYRWAHERQDGRERACYLYLHNILADPDRLPRYLLKCIMSLLVEGGRGPLDETPLYRLVNGAIRHAVGAESKSYTLQEGVAAYGNSFIKSSPFPKVHEILLQFRRHTRPEMSGDPARRYLASQAVAWLSGEEIDDEPARSLGFKVTAQAPVVLRDDHEIEQVILALARLAQANAQPFVLCVDQVDNLDRDKLMSLVRFLHALIDHGQNLLVIISGVKETLLGFRNDECITEAAWDRIAEYKVELQRIDRVESRHILEARLERFFEPFMQLEPVRRHVTNDTLFPLGHHWLEQRLGKGLDFRPRDILTWAREAWEEQQAQLTRSGGEPWLEGWPNHEQGPGRGRVEERRKLSQAEIEAEIDAAVDRKIEEQVSQRRLQPGSLPPDAGNLAGLVETVLAQCGPGDRYTFRGLERMKKKGSKLPPYDLKVREHRKEDGKEILTGVLAVTNIGLSATTALRRLLEDDHPPDHRILVTDHERRPLKVGPQGVEYYKNLEKLGREKFEHLKIDFAQYAALDALEGVVIMARVGDLEIEVPRGTSRPVTEAEVIESHHRKDRYRSHPLLRPLLTEEPPIIKTPDVETIELDKKDVRQYVMAQLAFMMGTTAHAIAKGYIQVMKAPTATVEVAWPQVKSIAEEMHGEALIHAQPLDDDLYLLLRK